MECPIQYVHYQIYWIMYEVFCWMKVMHIPVLWFLWEEDEKQRDVIRILAPTNFIGVNQKWRSLSATFTSQRSPWSQTLYRAEDASGLAGLISSTPPLMYFHPGPPSPCCACMYGQSKGCVQGLYLQSCVQQVQCIFTHLSTQRLRSAGHLTAQKSVPPAYLLLMSNDLIFSYSGLYGWLRM